MNNFLSLLRARWHGLARREQQLLLAVLTLLLGALLWSAGLAPALKTLREADSQHRLLDAQLQHMLSLQVQARAIQAHPQAAPEDARGLLVASVKEKLGARAQLTMEGDHVRVMFKGVPAEALAQWLAQARLNARAVPDEGHLMHAGAGIWDGKLLLDIAAR